MPPHALEAERAVLGGVLLRNETLNTVLEILETGDFYSQGNQRIFRSMLDLFRAGQPIDLVTLREALQSHNQLRPAGGDEYLFSLTDTLPSTHNIEAYAKIVHEKAVVRRLIDTCHELIDKGYGDYGDMEQFLDGAEGSVFQVAKVRHTNPYEHVKDVVLRTFKAINDAAQRREQITGIPTGFERLDRLTAGLHGGELLIVAGRPGMGKTAFALNVGVNACQESAKGVAVFSLEMPKEQLVQRMLCSAARVDGRRLRTAYELSREDWPKLANAAGLLSELPIWIDDTPALSILELRAKARRLHSEFGLGLIVVDYLQLMRSGSRNESREQEISEISRFLKALAKELNLPVIALSQLNRGVESRGNKDKRPQLSDLRESGAIEQDADTIVFIYRDEVYNRDSTEQGIAEIIIGKQRSGPTGTVKCRFFAEYTRFDNLEEGYEDVDMA